MREDFYFDAIVIGAGHAGIEAGLALSRLGKKTLMLSISLDNVGYLACNPSIGGTAKAHLVREIDALGGHMGIAADKTLMQLRMLNSSKGFAVQSLRAQVDKNKYHSFSKFVLEKQDNLQLRQGEVISVTKKGNLFTVKTKLLTYQCRAVVFCCGVYLKSKIIIGSCVEEKGPSSFSSSLYLSKSLQRLGIPLKRFKTGTPARLKRASIDLSKLSLQRGEQLNYSFSTLSKKVNFNKMDCFLGYTNEITHQIIRENLDKTAKKSGLSVGTGARYCPSIEDKILRFNKERHQFFLEPEGIDTEEMYIQGISTSLPADIQLDLYRSIVGFERVEIMRDAYAIEYDCIDSASLDLSLMHKGIKGLFFAGQINGTSGYEEAAAQGIVAGINCARYLSNLQPIYFTRDNSYIGVMLDDLVTKGVDEPYRMMTSRAEFRLYLRQDNADLRLSLIAKQIGLISSNRYKQFLNKQEGIDKINSMLDNTLSLDVIREFLPNESAPFSLRQFIKRHEINLEDIIRVLEGINKDSILDVFINLRYSGYLIREEKQRHEQLRKEKMMLPADLDYSTIGGLRLEAIEKLNKVKPVSIGQALRISGVNPADINVILVKLKKLDF